MARRLPKATARRAGFAILAVVAVEVVGTIGFHLIEGTRWVDAFYFESMLATGQGPPFALTSDTGKIFASFMGFVSVGSVVGAFIFTVGPFIARMWREGIEAAEGEVRRIEHEARRGFERLEHDLSRDPETATTRRTGPDP